MQRRGLCDIRINRAIIVSNCCYQRARRDAHHIQGNRFLNAFGLKVPYRLGIIDIFRMKDSISRDNPRFFGVERTESDITRPVNGFAANPRVSVSRGVCVRRVGRISIGKISCPKGAAIVGYINAVPIVYL